MVPPLEDDVYNLMSFLSTEEDAITQAAAVVLIIIPIISRTTRSKEKKKKGINQEGINNRVHGYRSRCNYTPGGPRGGEKTQNKFSPGFFTSCATSQAVRCLAAGTSCTNTANTVSHNIKMWRLAKHRSSSTCRQ